MSKDKRAQLTIRDLGKMTKHEVRNLTSWLKVQIKILEGLTAKDKAWLVSRKKYAPIFRMGLMR